MQNTEELDLDGAFKEMCSLISECSDSKFIYDFFGCLFSPAEINDFAKRWLLVREIDKGTPQREIAKKFHVSLCKITRGSKELKKKDSAFRKMLDFCDNLNDSNPRTKN